MQSDRPSDQSSDNQAADIHVLDERWVKSGKKSRGSQGNDQEFTGIYHDYSNPQRRILVKKDEVVAKDIAELMAGRLWELLNPDMQGLAAEAQPILVNGQTRPDPTGQNVYITSLLYGDKQYNNLCADAFNAYHYSQSGKEHFPLNKPEARPAYHESNFYTNHMLLAGRYPGMERLAVISSFLDDIDFHGENIGTVPVDPTERPIELQYLNGKEIFFNKVRPVRIDYGWAFGGTRRKLDGSLHLFDFFRYVAPGEPLNYFRTYPKEFFYSPQFVQELIRLSCFPEAILASGLKKVVQEVTSFYGRQPLLAYCEWIGVTDYMKKERKIIIDETTDRDSLISYINVFMQVMLLARLQSAEKNSRKFASALNMTEEEFIFRKNSEIEKFNKLFGLKQKGHEETGEKEETNIAYITTEEYKADERKFYAIEGETPEEEFVFYVGSIIVCLDSILLKKEEYDDELERETFIKTAKEFFSDKKTLAFIVEFGIQDKIDKAINDSPKQALKLYYQIQMALNKRKVIYDPKVTVKNVVSFLFDEDNFQYQEEIKQHVPLLVDLINLGVSSYLEKTKNTGKWMGFLSVGAKNETEAARLISNMLSDDTQALETKLVAVCGVLAYHNKFSTLRQAIIEELKLHVEQKAYRLPEVLMSQLTKVYGYEEAAINKKIKDTPILTLLKEQKKLKPVHVAHV